jgi:hypothetical protein
VQSESQTVISCNTLLHGFNTVSQKPTFTALNLFLSDPRLGLKDCRHPPVPQCDRLNGPEFTCTSCGRAQSFDDESFEQEQERLAEEAALGSANDEMYELEAWRREQEWKEHESVDSESRDKLEETAIENYGKYVPCVDLAAYNKDAGRLEMFRSSLQYKIARLEERASGHL